MPTITSAVAPTPRAELNATGRGLVSETFPVGGTFSGSIPTIGAASGSPVAGLISFRAGDVVTNLVACVTVVGTSLSFAKLALYDTSGNFIVATSSVSASFNSGTGFKQIALTAPYTIPASGAYYVVFLQFGSGATGATLSRGGSNFSGTQIGTNPRPGAGSTAFAADLSSAIVFNDSNILYWFGAS